MWGFVPIPNKLSCYDEYCLLGCNAMLSCCGGFTYVSEEMLPPYSRHYFKEGYVLTVRAVRTSDLEVLV
jgi:hypothetical protein